MSETFLRCLEILGYLFMIKAGGIGLHWHLWDRKGGLLTVRVVAEWRAGPQGCLLTSLGFSSWVSVPGDCSSVFPPGGCRLGWEKRLGGHPEPSIHKCRLNCLLSSVLVSGGPLSPRQRAGDGLTGWGEDLGIDLSSWGYSDEWQEHWRHNDVESVVVSTLKCSHY